MKSILIKNGTLVSPVNGYHQIVSDILIENGCIAEIGNGISRGEEVIDAQGYLVTPGLIDIHTHCYPLSDIGVEPDVLGIQRGATTILDAGSAGPENFEDFKRKYIDTAKTKVFSCLNVSKHGLEFKHELNSMDKIDESAILAMAQKYPHLIVGLKARASQSVVQDMGLRPIVEAARIAQKAKLPLVVHVGNYPPALPDVLNILHRGDIVTHAYHGKKGGILNEKQELIPEAIAARERGVCFDVGHGVASFSFTVFRQALAKGFDCDMISTDLHIENYEGPVYSLPAVLSKVINCSERLEDAISKCTSVVARHFGLQRLGELKTGFIGDISIMKLADCKETVVDAVHDELQLRKKLEPVMCVISRGEESEIFRYDSK